MKKEIIEIEKYSHKSDEFYLIGKYVYMHHKYGMDMICGNNQTVDGKTYTNEEYILSDPNKAILAIRQRNAEYDEYSWEEQIERKFAEYLFSYGGDKGWSNEKILNMIKLLELDENLIADLMDEWLDT